MLDELHSFLSHIHNATHDRLRLETACSKTLVKSTIHEEKVRWKWFKHTEDESTTKFFSSRIVVFIKVFIHAVPNLGLSNLWHVFVQMLIFKWTFGLGVPSKISTHSWITVEMSNNYNSFWTMFTARRKSLNYTICDRFLCNNLGQFQRFLIYENADFRPKRLPFGYLIFRNQEKMCFCLDVCKMISEVSRWFGETILKF